MRHNSRVSGSSKMSSHSSGGSATLGLFQGYVSYTQPRNPGLGSGTGAPWRIAFLLPNGNPCRIGNAPSAEPAFPQITKSLRLLSDVTLSR